MDVRDERFLKILKAALEAKTVEPDGTVDDWAYFAALAKQHKALPLLCDGMPDTVPPEIKTVVRHQVAMQTVKSSRFLELYRQLRQAGLTPLVVKGITCRTIYPNPDNRISADEDVLLPQEQYAVGCRILEQFGMQTQDPEDAHVRAYRKADEPLFVELHRQLFDPENDVYGSWNRFFTEAFKQAEEQPVAGETVLTFAPTEYLLYLICHAFKHFLHSGLGIRQACDIAMYANARGGQIQWQQVLDKCKQIRAHLFAAAVFKIGQKYLTFDPVRACYPAQWQALEVDERALLEDLLSSGIYGGATQSRKHSSNMTLRAVADHNRGKKAKGSIGAALFPSARTLENRYPYLKKHPWLLPAAWAHRIFKYKKETAKSKDDSAREAVKIGNRRMELLRQYGVI